MKKRTRIRTVDGLEACNGRIGERRITVRVTSDGLGKSLSLADDLRGCMTEDLKKEEENGRH